MWLVQPSGCGVSTHYWVCNESSCNELGSGDTWLDARKSASAHVKQSGHGVRVSTVKTEILYAVSTEIRKD